MTARTTGDREQWLTIVTPCEAAYLMAGLLAEEFPEAGGEPVADRIGDCEFVIEMRRDPGRVFRARRRGRFEVLAGVGSHTAPAGLAEVRFEPGERFLPTGSEFIRFAIRGSHEGSILRIHDNLEPLTSARIAAHLARLLPVAEGLVRAREALVAGNPRRACFAAQEAMAAGGEGCCLLHRDWLARLHHVEACARLQLLEPTAAAASCRRALRLEPGCHPARSLLARAEAVEAGRASAAGGGGEALIARRGTSFR